MKIGYLKFKLQIIPWTIPKKLNHDFAELIHSVKFYIRALLAMGISSQYIEHTKINDCSLCNSKNFWSTADRLTMNCDVAQRVVAQHHEIPPHTKFPINMSSDERIRLTGHPHIEQWCDQNWVFHNLALLNLAVII